MTGKIKLNAASGGGSVSFQAPSSTGDDRIITLPTTADGTVLTTTNPKAGNIIQVVSTTKTDTFTTTSHSFTDITGLSVSITPASSSSKILIFAYVTGMGTANTRAVHRLLRDSTAIAIGDTAGNRGRAFGGIYTTDTQTAETISVVHQDSPSTTSATTYKIQIANGNNTDTVYVNRASGWGDNFQHPATSSGITVMEVAG